MFKIIILFLRMFIRFVSKVLAKKILLARRMLGVEALHFERLPKTGGCLLISTHVSLFDMLLIRVFVHRPIRFFLPEEEYHKWYLMPFARMMRAIPLCKDDRNAYMKGIHKVVSALSQGEVVCIFPEGEVSQIGKILPFNEELELIAKECDESIPLVPLYLNYIEKKWLLFCAKPISIKTPELKVRRLLQEIENSFWMAKSREDRPIHHKCIWNLRRASLRLSLADANKKMSGWGALTSMVALARTLKPYFREEKLVGIFLPTTIASTLVNLAVASSGRSSCNLNFTAGEELINNMIKEAKIKVIVTSRLFLEKIGLSLPEKVQVVYVEDLIKQIGIKEKAVAFFAGIFLPLASLEKFCGAKKPIEAKDPLSILFTSGSMGEAKGVILNHSNLISNTDAIFRLLVEGSEKKNQLVSLPFFHAFGYMLLWLGFKHRLGLILHTTPLEAKTIGRLVKKYKVFLMMSTTTFLRSYIKQVGKEQFASLEYVIAGAEKLSPEIAQAFQERFGIRPMAGYGTTECSPVITTNTLDIRRPGVYQVGTKEGSVGEALPGVLLKIVDPNSYKELPSHAEGMLLVKGPNVMQGYFNHEALTRRVMVGEWYITGDIAYLDEKGFLFITGREKRISKIGGELVPHVKVEDALHAVAETEESVFAVTAIPDEKRGEQLVVIHTLEKLALKKVLKKMLDFKFSKLYCPKPNHFIKVAKIPILGSGKVNLKMVKKIAMEQRV